MDTESLPKMITGSLVQPNSQTNLAGGVDDQHKLALLLKLGSHFWTPDFTPAQAKHLLKDYLEDLENYRPMELDKFCRIWRTNAANKSFPKVGQVIAGLNSIRQDITDAAQAEKRPQHVSRPLMWWHLPKDRWNEGWRECDVPDGELVKDTAGAKLRPALRLSYE